MSYADLLRTAPDETKLSVLADALTQLGAAPHDPDAKLSQPLPDDFCTAIRETWLRIGTHLLRQAWAWPLAVLRNSGETLTTPEDRARHAAFPAVVRVWRGFYDCDANEIERASRGMSWSTDPRTALVYATYLRDLPLTMRFGNGHSVLVRADVPRAAIHSVIGSEVIIDRPDEIVNIVAKRAPAPRPAAQSALAALACLGTRGFALPSI